jgi:hypothetical protein
MLIFQIDKVTFGFVGAVSQEQSDNVIHWLQPANALKEVKQRKVFTLL